VSTEVVALTGFRFWQETRGSTTMRAPVHCDGEAPIFFPLNESDLAFVSDFKSSDTL
jgi:hypothetical protein